MTLSPKQYSLALELSAQLKREDFIVGDSNMAAFALIESWPEWNDGILALFGPAGSGKSHLAAMWSGTAKAMQIRPGNLTDIIPYLTTDTAYLLDFGDKALASSQEEALFHLYNHVRLDKGSSLLMISQIAPARWAVTLPDLRSRLSGLTAAALEMPDDILMAKVAGKLFRDRQIQVEDKVIDFILPRLERSFAALQDIIARLDATSLQDKRRITVPLAREILHLR